MADSYQNHSDYYNISDNISFYQDYGPSVHDIIRGRIETQSAIYGIVLTIVTILVNSVVIKSCLRDPVKRCDAFYMQVMNFSISNIVVSLFVLPFTVYFILQPWYLGHFLCLLWIVLDIMIPFISLTILIVMTIDRILSISHPSAYAFLFQKCSSLITFIPWIVGLIIVVPVWTQGTIPYENLPGQCIVIVNTEAALFCHILTYYIPLVTLIILNLDMLILKLKRTSLLNETKSSEEIMLRNNGVTNEANEGYNTHRAHVRVSNVNRNQGKDVPTCTVASVCTVSLMFAGMWFPFQCVSILLTVCDTQTCLPTAEFSQVVTWMGASSSAVAPLFWVIDSSIRNGSKHVHSSGMRKSAVNSSISEETVV